MEWVREKQNAQADPIEHPHYPYAWKRRFLPEAKRLLKALPAS